MFPGKKHVVVVVVVVCKKKTYEYNKLINLLFKSLIS
jgi:hypothetical protein